MDDETIQQLIKEVREQGYCILRNHFSSHLVEECREAFWPRILDYLGNATANRGHNRHFLPMPFCPPCFVPQFFFDPIILAVVRGLMGDRIVADQWGCDVPVLGSDFQGMHVDYQRPLFQETPDLVLPPYAIVISFGLVRITLENGPIALAPGTHCMARAEAFTSVEAGKIPIQGIPLELGDVLIRHPWVLHQGTPNTLPTPRPLVSIRYVRRWYADASRDVECISRQTWDSLTKEQQQLLRFPIGS
jgi:hypothetical protein